jgi:thiosulfate/3-mercaptopyruvate sulfurtransferase
LADLAAMAEEKRQTNPLLVSTDWLVDRLGSRELVVVDGSWHLPTLRRDGFAEYRIAHIPGAVFFDIDEVADHSSDLPHMLPPPDAFALHMTRLGIGDGMKIVVYDAMGLYSAPRVWWTLRAFGAHEVSILDGGLTKWRAEGRPVESGMVTRKPAHFTVKFDPELVYDIHRVAAAIEEHQAQVVDARSAERFAGTAPEPRPGLSSGHIPGSLNVPYASLIENGRLKPPQQLAGAFVAAGVDLDQPIVTSCGSGVTAAILNFALATLGKDRTSLYDGSWAEWGSKLDRPVATGAD